MQAVGLRLHGILPPLCQALADPSAANNFGVRRSVIILAVVVSLWTLRILFCSVCG